MIPNTCKHVCSRSAAMSPAYVGMMVRSLVENGFLAAMAPRKYEITPQGMKLLERGQRCPESG